MGFEPTRPLGQRILSPPCLPFHHPGTNVSAHMSCVPIVANCGRKASRRVAFTGKSKVLIASCAALPYCARVLIPSCRRFWSWKPDRCSLWFTRFVTGYRNSYLCSTNVATKRQELNSVRSTQLRETRRRGFRRRFEQEVLCPTFSPPPRNRLRG